MKEEIEHLVVQMAKENPGWGYDRIVGAMANLGHRLSDQTVSNILRRHGLSPAPKRKQVICRRDFILTEPLDNHGWEWRCYMRDPDGYLIEIGQYSQMALDRFTNDAS